jgi:thymidine phosphorylase
MIGQTDDLRLPIRKYMLCDVTATVENAGLITATSSKKIAEGKIDSL